MHSHGCTEPLPTDIQTIAPSQNLLPEGQGKFNQAVLLTESQHKLTPISLQISQEPCCKVVMAKCEL